MFKIYIRFAVEKKLNKNVCHDKRENMKRLTRKSWTFVMSQREKCSDNHNRFIMFAIYVQTNILFKPTVLYINRKLMLYAGFPAANIADVNIRKHAPR